MTVQERVVQAIEQFGTPSLREKYFDLYAEGVDFHGYAGIEPGLENVRQYYRAFWAAFPDVRIEVDDLFSHQDKVVLRYTVHGTHLGPFLGLAPGGQVLRLPGIAILRFSGDRCVERWTATDSLVLLKQLQEPGAR